MCSINRIVAVLVLVATSGALSEGLAALVTGRSVTACEYSSRACE